MNDRSNIIWMLIGAAIFGWLGFGMNWITTGANNQYLFFVDLMQWTCRAACIAFLFCAGLSFAAPRPGNLLYGAVSILTAVALIIVVVLDLADPQHTVMHPMFVLILAAIEAYSGWISLSIAMQQPPEMGAYPAPREDFPPR